MRSVIGSAADAELGLCRHIRQRHVQSMLLRVIGCFQRIGAAGKLRFGMCGRPVVNYDFHQLPPRGIRSLARTKGYSHRVAIGLTGERLAEELSVLIAEGVPVIEIERTAALRAGIDMKLQRTAWSFVRVLD